MKLTPATLYIGGTFTNVGSTLRRRLAEVDRTTGLPTAFDPNVLGRATVSVLSLALSSDRLYIGGNFTNIGSATRNSAASFDLPGQSLQPWNPGPTVASATTSANVLALALGASTVYLGGDFINLGGQARNRIGEVSTVAGTATAWNPNAPTANQLVAALELVGDTVYAGGTFTTIGGQTRNRIAALSTATGLATTWNPDATGGTPRINSIAVGPHTLYAGGQYTTLGGEFRNRIAGLNLATAQADDWNPSLDTAVRTILRTEDAIYLGGDFTTVGGAAHAYFAVFSARPEILFSTYRLTNGTASFNYRSGDGQRVIVQATADFQQWQNLQTNVPNGSVFTNQESLSVSATNRFYRVILE
jgi:trimeric autotransporter adhesin